MEGAKRYQESFQVEEKKAEEVSLEATEKSGEV
jgi:hypothetical protein